MSKRDTFKKNILAMTRTRSIKAALPNWDVKTLVNLKKEGGKSQACELCGTRFARGAMVSYPARRVTIAVGGTCLNTLLMERFADPKEVQKRRREVKAALKRRYGALVDPGTWINWIAENAPPRLARDAAELMGIGAVSSEAGFKKLIKFHDDHRKYPRALLLPDTDELVQALTLPDLLTITNARQIVKHSQSGNFLASVIAARTAIMEQTFLKDYAYDSREITAWNHLGSLSRRTVLALASLSIEADDDALICPVDLAAKWPFAGTLKFMDFVWGTKIGLAFVHDHEDFGPWSKTRLWRFAYRDYTEKKIDLNYMRSVYGAPAEAVAELEKLAFGRGVTLSTQLAG